MAESRIVPQARVKRSVKQVVKHSETAGGVYVESLFSDCCSLMLDRIPVASEGGNRDGFTQPTHPPDDAEALP
jgi:hypothetical protein